MYEGREVFPRAPLVFVTAELRFSYEPSVNDQSVRDAFGLAMRSHLPVLSMESSVSFSLQVLGGEAAQDTVQQIRAANEARTQSVSLSPNALTVEVIQYDHYEDFRRLIEASLDALAKTVPEVRVARLGLRYLDEIRVPNIESSSDWEGWISPELLAAKSFLPEKPVDGLSGQMLFHLDDQSGSLLRWGEVQGSTVLNPGSALRVAQPEPSRFFVLDVDSFWDAETPSLVDRDHVLSKFDDLHMPAGIIFTAATTERARRLFRGGIR